MKWNKQFSKKKRYIINYGYKYEENKNIYVIDRKKYQKNIGIQLDITRWSGKKICYDQNPSN